MNIIVDKNSLPFLSVAMYHVEQGGVEPPAVRI